MSRKFLGVFIPFTATLAVLLVVWTVGGPLSVSKGIVLGMILALAQSCISVMALDWAWDKKFVYWIWGGGMFFRMAIFAGTAFVVYRYTRLSLVSTMVSMVMATTIFLVFESSLFFGKR